ncbi:RNA-directed DNA polymerase from mobile element jockey-like, partial [Paramuricea clavata]
MASLQFVAPLIIFLLGCLLQQKLSNDEVNSHSYIKGIYGFQFGFRLAQERRLSGHEALNKFCRTTIVGKNKYHFLYLLLLLGGDIEQNPGEDCKRPCGICSDPIMVDQLGMNCDECDTWIHLACCEFDDDTHDILSGSSLTWLCPACGFSNFSKSLLNESIESLASPNAFAPLEETSVEPQDIPETKAKFQKHLKKPRANKCKLTCLLVNCQSVRNKVAEFEAIIDKHEPDIIIGNESWLHSGIASNEIFPDNYNIFRKDRTTDRHGGVFQAVKKDILVTDRSEFDTDCEIVWTQCQIKSRKSKSIFFASYYRPNMTDMVSLDELNNSLFKLSDKLNNHHVILAGDFNAPNIDWKDYAPVKASVHSDRLLEIINEHGLNQMVKEPTRSQGETHNILDMIFTNNENIINNVKVLPGISDHDIVYFQVNLNCKKKRHVKRKIFIRKRADKELIQQKLRELANNFECSVKQESLDTKWDAFQQ